MNPNPNPNPNSKGRSRGRGGSSGSIGGGGGSGPNLNNKKPGMVRNGSFDSNGPPPRARGGGNAHQMMEKYLAMARDAASQGDRVLAENYFQHADHYYRVMSSIAPPVMRHQRPPDSQPDSQPDVVEESGFAAPAPDGGGGGAPDGDGDQDVKTATF